MRLSCSRSENKPHLNIELNAGREAINKNLQIRDFLPRFSTFFFIGPNIKTSSISQRIESFMASATEVELVCA